MSNLLSVTKRIIKVMVIMTLGAALLSFFLFSDKMNFLQFFSGAVLGVFLSAVKLIAIEKTIDKSLDMEKNKASLYSLGNYILRFFVTIVVLGVSVYISKFICFGIILGLLSLQLSVYVSNIIFKDVK